MEQDRHSKLRTKQQDKYVSVINALRSLQGENKDTESIKHDKDSLTKILAEALAEVISNHKTDNDSHTEITNKNTSEVSNSGNSDVDIKIHIDLSSIAFAMLYSLYANKQLSNEELESAINKLKEYNSK